MVTACTALPSPALQCPELLDARPEETAPARVSCAELMARDEQSLVVNQAVAVIAGDSLLRLLVSRDLKCRFGGLAGNVMATVFRTASEEQRDFA